MFSRDELDRLFSAEGDRIDIADRRPGLPSPFFVELRPGKATLFCPGATRGSAAMRILDNLAQSTAVREAAQAHRLSVVRGKDFIDIGTTKLQGLQAMMALPEVSAQDLTRFRLCIGDSENDAGLFQFCRKPHGGSGSARIFVGADRRAVAPASEDDDLIHLEEGYLAATACVFATMVGANDQSFPAAWRDMLRGPLAGRTPEQVLAITDMTGCHLHQAPRQFPEAHRENLRRFIALGGRLWLVSGDALPVIEDHFIRELGDLGSGVYYVISSAGYRIDIVQHAHPRPLWVSPPIDAATRRVFLDEAVALILRETS